MAIEGSRLHDTLQRRWLGRPEWPELLAALNRADEVPLLVNHDANSVDGAMTWSRSPQGVRFWSLMNSIDVDLRDELNDWGRPQQLAKTKPKEKKYAAEYR